jgi:hypothetical protein
LVLNKRNYKKALHTINQWEATSGNVSTEKLSQTSQSVMVIMLLNWVTPKTHELQRE